MNKTRLYKVIICMMMSFIWLSSCSDSPRDVETVGKLPEIFPDYAGVTVPSTIAPLNFQVMDGDKAAERVDVTVAGHDGEKINCNGKYARFDIDAWHRLLESNRGKYLTVTVKAEFDGKWYGYEPFTISVSNEPLDEWGLTYRRIAPGYEVYSSMGLYQRNLSNFDEFPIIENTMTGGQCYNCHTANRTSPKDFVFHVRGEHGATMVYKDGKCTWLKASNDTLGGTLVYPYWHPEGRYCVFSTNKTRQGFHIAGSKRLEVFDLSSDVVVYDTERNVIIRDSLLSTTDWSENTPSFSPDGKWIYYTTAFQKDYPLQHKDERYNLCRIPFDASSGKVGTRVDTLFNADAIGKSVTWPRPSYDGKYLLFTLSDYGYFSIWHKESDQWLLDLANGEARPLEEINSAEADSFHNWSGNSRWVVFTSRRHDGLYSHLYLTSIDDKGRFTKPFMLPQLDPAGYYENSLYSFNTPDFTDSKVDFDSRQAVKDILGDKRVPTNIE